MRWDLVLELGLQVDEMNTNEIVPKNDGTGKMIEFSFAED